MPSPFPGMDPYLEDPAVWPGFHHQFISEIQGLLNKELDPRYLVDVEVRVYVLRQEDEDPIQQIIPDVMIEPGDSNASVGLLTRKERASQPIAVLERWPLEVSEGYLVIRSAAEREVVTIIEVLSPANKAPGSRGHRAYLRKRRAVMRTKTNLVEIDLLRAGLTPFPRSAKHPSDYRAYLSVARKRPSGLLWPFDLVEPLPTIRIPLRGEETSLDLQRAFEKTYNHVRYGSKIDYDADPVPPLSPAQAKWARKLLKARKA